MIYFTADLHLNHENIIKYCNRPFRDIEHHNKSLVNNWNQRVKDNDTVYHLGDFCFNNKSIKSSDWEKQLNGKIIHIKGNHDKNNHTKTILKKIILEFGNKSILARHEPVEHIECYYDMVLCGHVHEKWKYRWVFNNFIFIPVINVGVDQWNFMPVRLDEILSYYDRLVKNRG